MRLSLNNWPPLASHFLCLLLGAVLTNWQTTPGHQPPSYPRHKVTLALPASYLAAINWDSVKAGALAGLAQSAPLSGQALCRLKPDFIKLLQVKAFPVIQINLKDLHELNEILQQKSNTINIYPFGQIAPLGLCHTQPKVSYGSSF